MPAFEGAVALGYRYVETDVHLTSDGVLVAFHDDRLDRVTDRKGLVAELPWAEVAKARVGGLEPIVRFDELLAAWPDLRINIDPKHDASVVPLAQALQRASAVDRVCVGAFSDRRIAHLRTILGPALCTSLGPKATTRLLVATRGVGTPRFEAAAAQVPVSHRGIPLVTRRFVDGAHRLGLVVHVWTIDDPTEMRRLLDLGVDGLMTDRPGVLKDVLIARDQWYPATS